MIRCFDCVEQLWCERRDLNDFNLNNFGLDYCGVNSFDGNSFAEHDLGFDSKDVGSNDLFEWL